MLNGSLISDMYDIVIIRKISKQHIHNHFTYHVSYKE